MKRFFVILTIFLVGSIMYNISAEEGINFFGERVEEKDSNKPDQTKHTGVGGKIIVTEALRMTAAEHTSNQKYPSTNKMIKILEKDNPFFKFADSPEIGKLTIRVINDNELEICTRTGIKAFFCARQKNGTIETSGQSQTWGSAQKKASK